MYRILHIPTGCFVSSNIGNERPSYLILEPSLTPIYPLCYTFIEMDSKKDLLNFLNIGLNSADITIWFWTPVDWIMYNKYANVNIVEFEIIEV